MNFLYTCFIYVYSFLIKIAALINSKAKLWVDGRKDGFKIISQKLKNNTSQIAWFHCASLGEFEQARPLIEKFKEVLPDWKICLTFFSPSGFEVRKNYSKADFIFYLPADTPKNASCFVDLLNPKMVFFIKYEFWFNYLDYLQSKNIPTYLVSGIFRENHYFFAWYGKWFLKQLKNFSFFFLQNESSAQLLKKNGYNNFSIVGDTRFDRVCQNARQIKKYSKIDSFKNNGKLLVAGSTWLLDEQLIINTFPINFLRANNFKLIIVPHDVNEKRLSQLKNLFKGYKCVFYSSYSELGNKSYDVMIIDTIGMLASLYYYAEIVYVGGGFNKGIHNVLEPAVYGKPIFFGPNFNKFNEAVSLVKNNLAFSVTNKESFLAKFKEVNNVEQIDALKKSLEDYVNTHIGATDNIWNNLKQSGLF